MLGPASGLTKNWLRDSGWLWQPACQPKDRTAVCNGTSSQLTEGPMRLQTRVRPGAST